MDIILYIALGLFGAAFGSFAVAQVWRIRAFQLKEDLASGGEEIDIAEWRKLKPTHKCQKIQRQISLFGLWVSVEMVRPNSDTLLAFFTR